VATTDDDDPSPGEPEAEQIRGDGVFSWW